MGAEAKGHLGNSGRETDCDVGPGLAQDAALTHANKTCCAPSRAVHVKRLGTHLRLRMP